MNNHPFGRPIRTTIGLGLKIPCSLNEIICPQTAYVHLQAVKDKTPAQEIGSSFPILISLTKDVVYR